MRYAGWALYAGIEIRMTRLRQVAEELWADIKSVYADIQIYRAETNSLAKNANIQVWHILPR